jgi:hypothetical protein
MARLPTAPDLGYGERPASTRPTGTFDATPIARGEAAIGHAYEELGQSVAKRGQGEAAIGAGVAQLGAGFAKFGAGLGEVATDENRFDYTKAHADFLSRKIDLDAATSRTQEYGPDDAGKDLPTRYKEQLNGIRASSANMIQDPRWRDLFMTNSQTTFEQGVVAAQSHARSLSNDAQIGYVAEMGNKAINQAVAAKDDDTRTQLIDAHNHLIDGLADSGAISSAAAVKMKQDWAHQYATADLLVRTKEDPEGVVNELRAAPGSPQSVSNRIISIEGSSSAEGRGQFVTWLDVLKRNRPGSSREGRSDQELLALRADKNLGREMTEAYRAENERYLRAQGIEATPGAQYLAHFLGPAGAPRCSRPIRTCRSPTRWRRRSARRRRRRWSRPTRGPAGQARGLRQADWADGKMGGAHPAAARSTTISARTCASSSSNQAEGQLQKRRRNRHVRLQAADRGHHGRGRPHWQCRQAAGAVRVHRQSRRHRRSESLRELQANLQLGRDVSDVARLTPEQQEELVKSYEPKPGAEGFADQAGRQDQVRKAVIAARKQRDQDPAQYAVTRIPAVQEAWSGLNKVLADPQLPVAAKQQAARTFADITMLEQQKAGVAPTDIQVLPKGYVESLKARLENPQEAGGTSQVVKQLTNEATLWGSAWPQVYRQIASSAGPLPRVIGSMTDAGGHIVNEGTAKKLVELAPLKLGEILKDESAEKSNQIKRDVLDAFQPLLKSMGGNEGGLSTFNDFRGQAEKLAASYIVGGMSSADASKKAFKELIGDRYDFRDNWRMPKGLPQSEGQGRCDPPRRALGYGAGRDGPGADLQRRGGAPGRRQAAGADLGPAGRPRRKAAAAEQGVQGRARRQRQHADDAVTIFTDGLRLESADRPLSDFDTSFGAQIGATAAEALVRFPDGAGARPGRAQCGPRRRPAHA